MKKITFLLISSLLFNIGSYILWYVFGGTRGFEGSTNRGADINGNAVGFYSFWVEPVSDVAINSIAAGKDAR